MTEQQDSVADVFAVKDPEEFAANLARLSEETGHAIAAIVEPMERGEAKTGAASEATIAWKTIGHIVEKWASDPARLVEAQTSLVANYMGLWSSMLRRFNGEQVPPAAEPDLSDKRFQDPDWSKHPMFDFIKQVYLITSRWADDIVERTEGIDDHTKDKARFYVRQIVNALSPTNFVMTNPEVLRETLASNGQNLVDGMKMMAEDIRRGQGELRLRQSDPDKFGVGVNLATTPGKVVYQNDIMQLIQYEPATEQVLKRPLLIVPPWINKFYILDLNAEKSFIRWAVEQGHTVFTVSWVNPGPRQALKSFPDYMRDGPLQAAKVVKSITGDKTVNAIGYCVGGTLLSYTLAYTANLKKNPFATATLLTTQVDFTHAGDLKVFVDEEQIQVLEEMMAQTGYLDGSRMANAFNMLRANDLIWPYVINNYLKGKKPFPFDLLYWNSDATRMPAANHSYYLRNCYLHNNLAAGALTVSGKPIDLRKVETPIYNLATKEDHIAPALSVFHGSQFFGGDVEFVLSGSGHIAGVINPPSRNKYQFWTGGKPKGQYEDWFAKAKETGGSWWPHWHAWIEAHGDERTKARKVGNTKYPPREDAPGSYVKVRV